MPLRINTVLIADGLLKLSARGTGEWIESVRNTPANIGAIIAARMKNGCCMFDGREYHFTSTTNILPGEMALQ